MNLRLTTCAPHLEAVPEVFGKGQAALGRVGSQLRYPLEIVKVPGLLAYRYRTNGLFVEAQMSFSTCIMSRFEQETKLTYSFHKLTISIARTGNKSHEGDVDFVVHDDLSIGRPCRYNKRDGKRKESMLQSHIISPIPK
jgi:hypothetical protein